MSDSATYTGKTTHVYVGWRVTLPNGNQVNFTEEQEAITYGHLHGAEPERTASEVRCGLERGRAFCGHCEEATYSRSE